MNVSDLISTLEEEIISIKKELDRSTKIIKYLPSSSAETYKLWITKYEIRLKECEEKLNNLKMMQGEII